MSEMMSITEMARQHRAELERIHSHLSDAAANPGSRENLLAIIEINRDAIGALLEGK